MSVFYQYIIQVSTRRGVVAALICVVFMRGWGESSWHCSTLLMTVIFVFEIQKRNMEKGVPACRTFVLFLLNVLAWLSSCFSACLLLGYRDWGLCMSCVCWLAYMVLLPSPVFLVAVLCVAWPQPLRPLFLQTDCATPHWHWCALWNQLLHLWQPQTSSIVLFWPSSVLCLNTIKQSVNFVDGLILPWFLTYSYQLLHAGHSHCLNTERARLTELAGFDCAYTFLRFFQLLTATHCCYYALSMLDHYLCFLVNPLTEGFTLCAVWVCYLLMKPYVLCLSSNLLVSVSMVKQPANNSFSASTALRLFLAVIKLLASA